MRIGVAATGGSLEAQVSEQFGRCPFFVIVDSDTMNFEAFNNDAMAMSGGAGPAAVRELANRQVAMVLAGKFGPKAEDALRMAGIDFVRAEGPIRQVVKMLPA